jgi:molybdate transport system regulatory protein
MGHASADGSSSEHPARGGHRAVHRRSLRSVPAGPGVGAFSPGYRIWLHVDGVRMFGPGTHELLRRIDDTGSLHQAAELMAMSYTKAWHLLRKTEEHLGWALVERRVGGAAGGGTSLTRQGRDLLERFEEFMAETDAAMLVAFDAAFGGWQTPPEPEPDATQGSES